MGSILIFIFAPIFLCWIYIPLMISGIYMFFACIKKKNKIIGGILFTVPFVHCLLAFALFMLLMGNYGHFHPQTFVGWR